MRIADIKCDLLLLDVNIPVRDVTTPVGALLVTVEDIEGRKGYGLAHESHAQAVQQVVLNTIAPFLKELGHIHTPHFAWHEANYDMPHTPRNASGVAARAMSAVDQALWDLHGRILGQPVYKLLGGAQPEIEVYATFGLNIYAPDEQAEAASGLQKKGYRTFKLQGSDADRGRDVTLDSGRVRQLRETLGDEARIILDGRTGYSLHQAIELARLIEPYNVTFFDEPLYVRDPVGMRMMREACPRVPLAARSAGGKLWDNRDLIASGALSAMGVSVMDQGGFSQSIKVAHAAEMFHLPIVTGGGWHIQNAHLIAAVSNGWMTEHHSLFAGLCDLIFAGQPQPENGKLVLGDAPGFGIEPNAEAIAAAKDYARSGKSGNH